MMTVTSLINGQHGIESPWAVGLSKLCSKNLLLYPKFPQKLLVIILSMLLIVVIFYILYHAMIINYQKQCLAMHVQQINCYIATSAIDEQHLLQQFKNVDT